MRKSTGMLSFVLISLLTGVFGDPVIRITPYFVSIPPPVTYLDPSRIGLPESARLVCEIWPPNANVSILSLRRSSTLSQDSPLPLTPLSPKAFHQRLSVIPPTGNNDTRVLSPLATQSRTNQLPSPFSHVVMRVDVREQAEDIWRFNNAIDLHCKASTSFGAILSAPFRILQTRMGSFDGQKNRIQHGLSHTPPSFIGNIHNSESQFIQGNTAYVSCNLPTDSHPPPIVQFLFNDKPVDIQDSYNKDKYRQIERPNENRILLLINPFKRVDEGRYQCSLTNPITGQTVISPEIWNLTARMPTKPEPEKVRLELYPQNNSSQRQILVEEGDNVTLFCLIEGAPPPQVRIHKYVNDQQRFQVDAIFGLIHIPNVRVSDGALYVCESATNTISTATLIVKPRLHLIQPPANYRISSFGNRAEFYCNSSDLKVLPFWLFNGEYIPSKTPNILSIDAVKESDLGIYQCVVRSQTPDGQTDKWVSASATLSLQTDKLITQESELMDVIPKIQRLDTPDKVYTAEMTPNVEMVFDNLAVYLKWQLSVDTLRSALLQTSPVWNNSPVPPPHFRVDYAIQTSQPVLNPGLIGLVEPEPATWTSAKEINQVFATTYAFITGDPLQPGKTYRFRVRAINPKTGEDIFAISDWSTPVNTDHISSVQPPIITSCQLYQDDRLNVTWTYTGDGSASSLQGFSEQQLQQQEQTFEVFKPDFFLILARSKLRTDMVAEGSPEQIETYSYGRYQATQVNGSNAREGFVYNMNASFTYQVIVYGVKFENGIRRITRFSAPKLVSLPSPLLSRFSFMEALMNNKLIFIGLGALAIFVLLVVLILIIVCIVRQRKDRRRRQVKQIGFVCGYSETDKYQNQQNSQQLDGSGSDGQFLHRSPSPSGKGGGGNGQQTGQSMMMGTLMRSNFSDTDAQKQASLAAKNQQFAMNSLPHTPHQQHTGSVMQLNNPGSGFYGGQGGYYHHQSHHSLLLPPSQGGVPVFQSGTLPGGPNKYMRQQQQAYQMAQQQQFGSQAVIGGGGEGDQASLMRDYFQQQQQQQLYQQQLQQQAPGPPPFMYAMNSPTAFMSPQQQMQTDTINRRQSHHSQQHYAGSMNSTASLRREPPPGSLIHDVCGMDATLLARTQMSPPGMQQQMDATSPTGQLPPPPPGYYQGSQQALHMPYNGGLGQQPGGYPHTPSQQMLIYQQHQQAAFMMQQMSPHQQPQFYGGPQTPNGGGIPSDPSLMRHPSIGRNTDGDSIYSYFSQQDVCHPQSHVHLNPLPEENHMNLGFAESGSQTAGLNGGGGTLTGTSVTGSPVPLGGHRHHRRRRRKQQAQQQQQMQPSHDELAEAEFQQQAQEGQFGVGGYNEVDQTVISNEQMHHQPQGSSGDGGQDNYGGDHHQTTSHTPSSGSPPAAAGLEGQQEGSNGPYRGNNQSLDRSASYAASPGMRGGMPNMGPLPPPSQPPPPPPAPQMGLPHSATSTGTNGGYYRPPPPHDGMMMMMDGSLNHRGGSMGSMGPSSSGGLLVGPPPRIRDYSEYGIPSGIHPVQTNGNTSDSPSKPAGMMMMMTSPPNQQQKQSNSAPAYNGSLQSPYNGRYREGQA